VHVWSNPISVDVEELYEQMVSTDAAAARERLLGALGEKTIVRVDRLDPAKNVAIGFEAFGRLLGTRPEWRGRAKFLAFLVPSRESVPEYAAYRDMVMRQVVGINARFGTSTWQPIEVFYEQNRLQALTALKLADVLLVNSVADGMNLVAKEGAVLNERQGVLVLSDKTGAFEELRRGAIGVDPLDVSATVAALEQALVMPKFERDWRAEELKKAVGNHQLADWLRLLLKDLSITKYLKTSGPEAVEVATVG
jgi:trehalose 6-phosphate synthase